MYWVGVLLSGTVECSKKAHPILRIHLTSSPMHGCTTICIIMGVYNGGREMKYFSDMRNLSERAASAPAEVAMVVYLLCTCASIWVWHDVGVWVYLHVCV